MQLRDFALLWTSSLANGVASQMIAVAIGWQVYAVHRNPLDLGLVGLAEFLPLLVFALPAGQIADRFSRRTVVAVGLVFQIVIATILVLITLSGANELWPFLTVGAIAPGSRSGGTTSGVSAPYAGQPIALETPVAPASARKGQSAVAP